MLRRSPATSQRRLGLLTTNTTRPCGPVARREPTRTLFDNLKRHFGAAAGTNNNDDNNKAKSSGNATDDQSASQTPPGFSAALNAQQVQTLQQLFNSQPKEKQEQLMKQAIQMQKMMGKVPGFGKLAQKNAAMLEQVLRMQSAAVAPPSSETTSTPTHTTTNHTSSSPQTSATAPRRDLFREAAARPASAHRAGPSLDDLKRVNLGPEIEALFAELRTIRSRKNEYRDKYHAAQSSLEELRKEHHDLVTREAKVRGKLAKAEQEVMLLTSENMELRDSCKAVKHLTHTNKQLKFKVDQLTSAAQASAAPGTAAYAALKQQHQATEDALRSLQRKVDRMRRRDPLLQFSLACSDVSRLCTSIRTDENVSGGPVTGAPTEAGQEAAEKAFADLQSIYHDRQQEAWAAAARDHGAAAQAYVAVVRRYVMARVPHANYDAVVSFTGELAILREWSTGLGFTVETLPGESNKVHVVAAAEAEPLTDKPGPYGYACALRLSAAGNQDEGSNRPGCDGNGNSEGASFLVTSAHPLVSTTMLHNARRSVVHYETARASGPGGQATNVTETQVYAKLSIDGAPAFTAEAQDSRSALSNKEAALEKLHQQRRHQYNDTLAKQVRAEVVQAQLVDAMRAQGVATMEDEVWRLVKEAAAAKQISLGDEALVKMVQVLRRTAASTV